MNKKKLLHAMYVAIVAIILIGISFICGRCSVKPIEIDRIEYDTVVVVKYDTLRFTHIVNQQSYVYDTIIVNDTVYLKDEPKEYADSCDDYRLAITAVKLYDYNLDIYKKDSVIEIEKTIYTERPRSWRDYVIFTVSFGAQYGIVHKQFDVGPNVGISIRLY